MKPNGAAYSDLKPAWHLVRIAQLRRGEQIVPAQIQLVISDLCNHDCGFCAYRMSGYTSNQNFGEMTPRGFTNNPNRMIPFDKCIEILGDAKQLGVEGIQFTGGGEPTVHPRHLDIIAHAQSLGLETALVSNGNILRDGWRRVYRKLSWYRMSLDAGTSDTYAAIRQVKPSAFHKALDHLSAIVEECRETVVGASFIVTKDNWRECRRAAEIVRDTGCPTLRFAAIFSPQDADYYDEIRDGVLDQVESAKLVSTDTFTVIDMVSQRLDDLAAGCPDYSFCGYQQFNCYIGGDLKVYRCCNTAYSDVGEVGSIADKSLVEFWSSDEKRKAYDEFDARQCERCAFNGKNRVINYMMEDPPLHAAFV